MRQRLRTDCQHQTENDESHGQQVNESVRTSIPQTAARLLLGAALLFTGITHLTVSRMEFRAQVPTWLPLSPDLVVILSGIVEISLGLALLLLGRHRVRVGWIVALFFICIFPGNIAQFIDHRNAFGLDTDRARFIRLFFQPLLVLWAVWSTGAWQNYRERKQLR
jgi:uncharacterized membrane protein